MGDRYYRDVSGDPVWHKSMVLRPWHDAVHDARPMSQNEIIKYRFEAAMMRRYGSRYLYSSTDGDFPMVMTGNPEQKILINASDELFYGGSPGGGASDLILGGL